MEHRSDLAGSAEVAAAPRPQRRHFRQTICSLVYVNLDRINGGIIRDLSESGIATQTVTPLQVNQQVHVRFELAHPRVCVDTSGRVAWADPVGQVGMEFLAPSARSQRQIKDWVFTQLLATAHRAAWDSIFIRRSPDEESTELQFSATSRPTICLASEESLPSPQKVMVQERKSKTRQDRIEILRLSWCPIPLSSQSLAGLVDSLILLSALLLFSVVAMVMTHDLPAWPLALTSVLGAAITFAALYWFLFVVWIGATPGKQLARIAWDWEALEAEERPRFR